MASLLLLPCLQVASAGYPEQPGGMLAPFVYPDEQRAGAPPAGNLGISFSGFFTDHTVLQRGAKSQAAVYGAVLGSATAVTVDVSEAGNKYTVHAQIVDQSATNLTWKAFLHPHSEYGGNVTLTATCSGCSGIQNATISDLTYGDVWFCSGRE
jgi:hypothetical protein